MSLPIHLNERQQHILWATVRHYIATAEPVGSKALVDEFNLSVSPATIRNAMNGLEKAGLLYQPHPSAGRIPSDSGYRLYVDQLITPSEKLGARVEQVLDQLNWSDGHIEAVLRGAAQILATLSGYITLITLPQWCTTCIRHVQLVPIESDQVMLIVVMDTLETQSILMNLAGKKSAGFSQNSPPLTGEDSEILEEELKILSNFLNHHLKGRTLPELSHLDWGELDRKFQGYAEFIRHLFTNLGRRHQTPHYTRILISGLAEVLRLPEFSQLQQVQTLIQLLEEEQEQLWPLIFVGEDHPHQKRVNVRIGSENPLEPIRGCTLISATYRRGQIPVGSVGVLGPTRMVYENAIAVVEAASDYLSEVLGGN